MLNFFVTLNEYLAGRKTLFAILVIALLLLAGYLASGVRLEEDISAIIPTDQRISRISKAFDRSELADQIVFILSLADSSVTDPEKLIEFAGQLVNLLEKETGLVGGITFKVSEDAMMRIYDFIYENLPLFLDETDYRKIASMLNPTEIERIIEADFKSLISPAGIATGRFITKDPLSLTPLALSKLTQFQLDENFTLYNASVFTRDRKNLLLFLDPAFPSSNTRENQKLIELIDQTLESIEATEAGILVDYYGGTAVAVANSVRVKQDIRLTITIALVSFLAIFLLFFRRAGIILLIFVPVAIGILVSVAILTLIYGTVSAIALGVGVIFLGITVDYSLHLFTHYSAEESVNETLRRVSIPVLMSSLTTATAFLCLLVIRSEAMNQIGVFAAIAVMGSALSVLVITPLLLSRIKAGSFLRQSIWWTRLIEKTMGYAFEKNQILVGLIILLTLGLGLGAGKMRFNGDISSLNYMTDRLVQAEGKLNSISSVASSTVYLVTEGESLEEALQELESNRDLIEGCRNEGLVTQLSWVPDLMMTAPLQRQRIERWEEFWEKADRDLVIQTISECGLRHHFRSDAFSPFFNLLEKQFLPVPLSEYGLLQELFLDNYLNQEEGIFSVVSILKVKPANKAKLFSRIASSDDFIIFDNQYFINRFFEVLKEDFSKLVRISMILVFVILLVFFGRIEIALITFIPILISWLWTLGLMGWSGIELNIFNIIISTFVFGLGIDYSIFIMNGILDNFRMGKKSLVPYRLSVMLSALTTVAGIGVLIFARHPALKSIAVISIFGLSSVVVISYTLLPLFFGYLSNSGGRKRLVPVTLFGVAATLVTFLLFLGSALIVSLFLPFFAIFPVKRRIKKRIISQIIYLFCSFIASVGFFIRKRYIRRDLLDFTKPAVIISNHQSQLDLVFLLQLHPKMIVLVNRWVWNNPFYGFIIRFADYYPIYKGLDYNLEQLKQKVKEGYSILAFPEASRSPDGTIKRFHQGSFGIAAMLGLEIQPVMIHGAYDCLPKTEHVLKPGTITLKCFPKFRPEYVDHQGIKTFREQVKMVTAFYRREYRNLVETTGTPDYFKHRIIGQYLYKGPVLEWYLRVKLKLEENYRFYNDLIPRNASVVDLGCGYGFLSVMLGLVSRERTIVGMDYDELKITTARNAVNGMDHVRFIAGDITRERLPDGEVYILQDVLHYLPEALQMKVLDNCMDSLPSSGMVILRDADTRLKRRNAVTRFTEFQSTRVFRFNKTAHPLTFLSGDTIESFVEGKGFQYRRIDHSRLTSNVTYLITRKMMKNDL
jgi:1-acyl-sn-glycerol-3-phosphate acyltransferase